MSVDVGGVRCRRVCIMKVGGECSGRGVDRCSGRDVDRCG